VGIFISIAVMFFRMGIMGTFWGVIMVHMINSLLFMVWIPAGSFRSVKKQQEEAVRDVGAGPIRAFFAVTLPQARPGIIVASVFTFLGSLEEAQGTLIVGMPNYRTIPVQLYGAIQEFPTTAGPVYAILLVIPTIVLMFLANKFVKGGIVASGMQMK
jgi:putative spermidine/putrescine transport system permease protein